MGAWKGQSLPGHGMLSPWGGEEARLREAAHPASRQHAKRARDERDGKPARAPAPGRRSQAAWQGPWQESEKEKGSGKSAQTRISKLVFLRAAALLSLLVLLALLQLPCS
jgi:hypothetical protein